ncbi:hypothetical protein GPECTOR_6g790 [Gonium pectorale]|uniref:J domain-containing protein n=1 Tax=Gonium pectorale TaxID=33097 RepID=A0A150GVY3_GONPE|nr:hypothetical protein GPECTOR_6g790 [Gonium pectorale]|eukprot:KXZ53872.1 hypothetical protein GPECTOR_6g790 [Gonium pectorale]
MLLNFPVVLACSSFLNPHNILGVSAAADVKEVKRAYRKLALQYHPDVCKTEDGHERFMLLTQAYEMLLGRAEGKADPGHSSSSGWDFHDWYWNFRMQRSWEKQHRHARNGESDEGATSGRPPPPHSHAGYKQPEGRANLRSQLAGLRHRAAVRAQRPASPPPPPRASATSTYGAASSSMASGDSIEFDGVGPQHGGAAASTAREGAPGAAGPAASASQFPFSWTWSWAWSTDDESEDESERQFPAAASPPPSSSSAAEADAGAGAHAGQQAGPGDGRSEDMAVHDGHFATVLRVANHAVPFPGVRAAATNASAQQRTSQDMGKSDGGSKAGTDRANGVQGGSTAYGSELDMEDEPEPEPFSNPFDRHPAAAQYAGAGAGGGGRQGAQQHYQQTRRRFAADSATRESVSHQLAGLRRKASMKVAAQGPADGAGAGSNAGSV